MKRLSQIQAAEQGYRSLTSDIFHDVDGDKHIVVSIESSMRGVDACWIVTGPGLIQLGRKVRELILPIDKIERIIYSQTNNNQ